MRAQSYLHESLGEMERKRSYRRDTVVLALPGMGKMANWEKGMDALRSKRRATGRAHALFTNTLYSRPEVRKRVIGSVTGIG